MQKKNKCQKQKCRNKDAENKDAEKNVGSRMPKNKDAETKMQQLFYIADVVSTMRYLKFVYLIFFIFKKLNGIQLLAWSTHHMVTIRSGCVWSGMDPVWVGQGWVGQGWVDGQRYFISIPGCRHFHFQTIRLSPIHHIPHHLNHKIHLIN